MKSENTYIYVLLLDHGKIFVHSSNSTDIEDIFTEYKLLYEYSIKYKPLNILDSFQTNYPESNNYLITNSQSYSTKSLASTHPKMFYLEIDKVVKQYMMIYGMENVRGGSYTNETFSYFTTKLLENELNIDKYQHNKDLLNQYKDYCSTHLSYEIAELDKYILFKNKYNRLKKMNEISHTFKSMNTEIQNDNLEEFDEHILNHLEWLYNICIDKSPEVNRKKSENIEKYRKTVDYIKKIYIKYLYVLEEKDDFPCRSSYILYMKYPEFLFDPFFYHEKKDTGYCLSENDCQIWEVFQLIYYTIYNRIQELEYDMSFFPKDIESLVAMKKRDCFHKPVNEKTE